MSNKSYQPIALTEFMTRYSTDAACREALEACRWPTGFVCPHCESSGGYRLPGHRGFECKACGRQVSVTSGTVLAYHKLPLPKIFLAMYLIAANKQGISAKSLAKHLAISEVTAWHLLHKLRSAMGERDEPYRIKGLIEVDESYVGGLAQGSGTRGRSTKNKTPVIALVEKRGDNLTGYVHLEPLHNITSKTLHDIIVCKVVAGSTIRTDGLPSYHGLEAQGFRHQAEISLGGQRACAQFKLVHRQFANLKSWLQGTHRNNCGRHLDRYVAEYCWRTNRRNRYDKQKRADGRESELPERMTQAVASSSRLTWMQVRRECWIKKPAKRLAA